eukprot:12937377-Prorocentrum_lima.AAC.1
MARWVCAGSCRQKPFVAQTRSAQAKPMQQTASNSRGVFLTVIPRSPRTRRITLRWPNIQGD